MIVDGKKIAGEILDDLKKLPAPKKFLGAVLVGDDPASLNFLKQKEKVAEELGISFRLYKLPADIKTDELRQEIGRLSSPRPCGGFIVQLPLPDRINKHYVLNAIPKEKDVDLLGEAALGAFYSGRHNIVPPSVGVVEEILKRGNLNLRQSKIVLIGAGFLIGKPVGFWLQNRVAELTVFDSSAQELRAKLKDADVVISGVGQTNLFSSRDLKTGALVIDFGWNKVDGKITGDFNPSTSSGQVPGSEDKSISYTKTPGGTGPILVAKLFENFYKLNRE
ncbi:bifunctional 5,10-methylenetetrahydrofolate dehydrogenase/5,10-methenyltetrahydrofolate cyclohydrolase [Candidatus Giovannonibacteria bacterium]|nr:bifunctional 5,10-methylenetetrahydrofolate dehydrogenase/5,10-methenyltetrahydrofolate cyclohydrolase [Candidatus Giovannonibacteria bacterium]